LTAFVRRRGKEIMTFHQKGYSAALEKERGSELGRRGEGEGRKG